MKSRAARILASVFLLASAAGISAAEYRADFDSPACVSGWEFTQFDLAWEPIEGEGLKWSIDREKKSYMHERKADDGRHAYAISPFKMVDGEIEARATVNQENEIHGGPSFGILKYIDEENSYVVRFGTYGTINIRILENGVGRGLATGYSWKPELGNAYTVRIVTRGDRMMILIDGQVVAAIGNVPFPEKEGNIGFYTLASADFDYLSAKGR